MFAAQVLALVGTGLLTVALGLLAVDVAGNEAGIVMGTALTIRIIAFVTILPVMSALDFLAQLCDTALWIDHGEVREVGPIPDIVGFYEGPGAAKHASKIGRASCRERV